MDDLTAAVAFAQAWNRLDPEDFATLLAEDVSYASQNVFAELEGKDEVLGYLRAKMVTVREHGEEARVYAELGQTTYPDVRPCVLLRQGDEPEPGALVILEVEDGLVRRIDLCTVAPHPSSARRSGNYPS